MRSQFYLWYSNLGWYWNLWKILDLLIFNLFWRKIFHQHYLEDSWIQEYFMGLFQDNLLVSHPLMFISTSIQFFQQMRDPTLFHSTICLVWSPSRCLCFCVPSMPWTGAEEGDSKRPATLLEWHAEQSSCTSRDEIGAPVEWEYELSTSDKLQCPIEVVLWGARSPFCSILTSRSLLFPAAKRTLQDVRCPVKSRRGMDKRGLDFLVQWRACFNISGTLSS